MTYPTKTERRRVGSWTIVAISCFALVATSAPNTAMVGAAAGINDTDDSAQFDVTINEDGVCEATGAGLDITVLADPTAEEVASGTSNLVATVTFGSADLPPEETPMGLGTAENAGRLVGNVNVGILDGCAQAIEDDTACTVRVNVDLSQVRVFSVGINATISNSESGCPIAHPSFSDDADVDIVAK